MTGDGKITFCGIFHNESERLFKLLPLVKSYCDQLICVVQESTDNTLDICKRYCDKVIETKCSGYSECDRGILHDAIDTEWILYLDADETPSKEFLEEMRSLTLSDIDAYGLTWVDDDTTEVRYRFFRKGSCFSLLEYHSAWRPYKNRKVQTLQYDCIYHFKEQKEKQIDIDVAAKKRYEIPFGSSYVFHNAKDIPLERYKKSLGFIFNQDVCNYLCERLRGKTIYDFNCGDGRYTQALITTAAACNGFSSNPLTPLISNGACSELDMFENFYVYFKRDYVISLQIPRSHGYMFLYNTLKHCNEGFIIIEDSRNHTLADYVQFDRGLYYEISDTPSSEKYKVKVSLNKKESEELKKIRKTNDKDYMYEYNWYNVERE